VVQQSLLISCREDIPADVAELISGYSAIFQRLISTRPRAVGRPVETCPLETSSDFLTALLIAQPYRSFLVTEHVPSDPDVAVYARSRAVGKYLACRLAASSSTKTDRLAS
jgi:hypothetical protein